MDVFTDSASPVALTTLRAATKHVQGMNAALTAYLWDQARGADAHPPHSPYQYGSGTPFAYQPHQWHQQYELLPTAHLGRFYTPPRPSRRTPPKAFLTPARWPLIASSSPPPAPPAAVPYWTPLEPGDAHAFGSLLYELREPAAALHAMLSHPALARVSRNNTGADTRIARLTGVLVAQIKADSALQDGLHVLHATCLRSLVVELGRWIEVAMRKLVIANGRG